MYVDQVSLCSRCLITPSNCNRGRIHSTVAGKIAIIKQNCRVEARSLTDFFPAAKDGSNISHACASAVRGPREERRNAVLITVSSKGTTKIPAALEGSVEIRQKLS